MKFIDTNDLVKLLPPGYEQACFDKKAITRKRTIKNPLDLLRLVLFYLSGNKSLIDVTHFALLSGIGKISDVAFMKKFIQCGGLDQMADGKHPSKSCHAL